MAHGASAPSPSDSDRSGTTRSGSISIWWPSPVQRGHAPCGLLNEKIRGSSSGIDVPHFRHAKRSEKVRTRRGRSDVPRGTSSTSTIPSASATAVSIESASRLRRSWRITSRSTTTEMSCLNFLSSSIGASSIRSSPSTLTRAKPSARSSSKSLPYSPLRPRTTGARTMKRSPSSSSMTWSMICSALWPAIGAPQLKQWGLPTRDHSSRR